MRSGLIFRASDHISNRFLLCRMIAASTRKMHRTGSSTSQSINQSLLALRGNTETEPQQTSPVTEAQLSSPVVEEPDPATAPR